MTEPDLIPLRANGRPLAGCVRKLSLWHWWWGGARAGVGQGRTRGVWLARCPGGLVARADADLVFLSGDGTVLAVHPDTPPWRWRRCAGARSALVLRPGSVAQLGLSPGQGLDLLA